MRVLSWLSSSEYGPMEPVLRCGPEQGQYLGRAHEPREERSDHAGEDRVDGIAVRSQEGKVLQPEQILVVSQRDHRAQPRAPRPGRPDRIDKVPRQVMCQVPAVSCRREHGDPPEFLRPGQAPAKVTRQLCFQAWMRQRSQVLDGQRVGVPGRRAGQDAVHDRGPVSVRRELHARLCQRERVGPGKAFRKLRIEYRDPCGDPGQRPGDRAVIGHAEQYGQLAPGQGPAGHVLGGKELGVLLVTEGDGGIGGDVEQRGPQHFFVLVLA